MSERSGGRGGRGRGGQAGRGGIPAAVDQSIAADAAANNLQIFQACRAQAIANGEFLNVNRLQSLLNNRFQRGLPHDVREALFATQRMVQEVGAALQVIFAGQNVITLFDLERQVLLGNRNFVEVVSFEELKLGPLRAHPLVQAQFKSEALASPSPPALTAAMVIEHIAEWLEKHWEEQPKGTKLDVAFVLEKLAERHSAPSVGALGVIIRSNAFLVGLLGRTINARNTAAREAARNRERQREKDLREEVARLRHEQLFEQAEEQNQVRARKDAARALRVSTAARMHRLLLDEGFRAEAAGAERAFQRPSSSLSNDSP
jgi:hypothetical protein